LRQYTSTFYLRSLWSALDGSRDEIREVIKLSIAIFVARDLRQLLTCLSGIVNKDGTPGIRMQL
jgi:hypothetical protein